ncbi:unnamed protein product, partial [Meganyctiphanes norvegica]
MVKRNYAHCPLKKRPLALYNEPASTQEQDQPEDLSVKRPRIESTTPEPADIVSAETPATIAAHTLVSMAAQSPAAVPTVPHIPLQQFTSVPAFAPRQQESMPTLAEYYLQLFRSTSTDEQKRPEPVQSLPQWRSPYLPPSPQASPLTPDQLPMPVSPGITFRHYPDSSALISPVSTCSSTASEEEDESSAARQQRRDSRYSCSDCGKSYSTYSGLSKHKQFHCAALGAKSFACKHCHKVYTSLGALKMHIRTHTLPCKCHLCGKAFSRPWLLQGHIRTHTGEKPFNCTQCDRSFADRSNLRAHLQTHADIKKYACNTCHKTFSRMSLLNKHTESGCPAIPGNQPNPAEQMPSPTSQEDSENEEIEAVPP